MAAQIPFPLVLAVIAIAGLSAGSINPMIDTILYALIPGDIRARTLEAMTAAVTAGMPFGRHWRRFDESFRHASED